MSRDERQEVCVTSSLLSLALGLEGAQSKGRFPEKKTVVLLDFVQTTFSPPIWTTLGTVKNKNVNFGQI